MLTVQCCYVRQCAFGLSRVVSKFGLIDNIGRAEMKPTMCHHLCFNIFADYIFIEIKVIKDLVSVATFRILNKLVHCLPAQNTLSTLLTFSVI